LQESSDEEEEEEKEPVKKKGKSGGDFDDSAAKGSCTVFIKNLPWAITEDDMYAFFEDCGEPVAVRIATDRETGRAKGFGHVQFADTVAAAKAIAKSGGDIQGRECYIDSAQERNGGGGGGGGGGGYDSAPRTPRERDDSRSIFIKGFDKYQGEQDVRAAVTELFSSCGEVVHVRLPTDRETGELKGFGFVEFSDPGAKDKAGELDGTEAAGGWLKVDTNPGGGGGGGGGGFSGGRGGGFSGGRGGGRFSGGECPPACSCSSS